MDQIEAGLWWLDHKEQLKKYAIYALYGVVGIIWIYTLFQLTAFLLKPSGQKIIDSFAVPPPATIRPVALDMKVSYSDGVNGGDALIELKNSNANFWLERLVLARGGQQQILSLKENSSRQIAWPESLGVAGDVTIADMKWSPADLNTLKPKINLTADQFKTELAGAQVVAGGLIRNEGDFPVKTIWVTVSTYQSGSLMATRSFSVSDLLPGTSRLVSTVFPLSALNADIQTDLYFQ